jgi:sugar lactone lactonase YvrE
VGERNEPGLVLTDRSKAAMPTKKRLISAAALMAMHCFGMAGVAKAHPGWGVVFDEQGGIYFSDVQTNTIWRIRDAGHVEAVVTGKHSHSLYMDEDGSLHGEHVSYDATNQRWISSTWTLTSEGQLIESVPRVRIGAGGEGFFKDSTGNVYTVDGGASESQKTLLLKQSPDGKITTVAGGERGHTDGTAGEARFRYIIGMAWGPDGSLYVTDSSCVRRVMMDGTVSTVGGEPLAGVVRSEYPRLLGIAVDSASNVYVADYDYHCLRRLTSEGSVSTVLSEGFYWSPSGVGVNGEDVYVLEHQPDSAIGIFAALKIGPYARIRKLNRDGGVATVATVWGSNTMTAAGAAIALAGICLLIWRRRQKSVKRETTRARGLSL